MTEKEYRELRAINYSLLAKLDYSPVGLEDKSEDTEYFTMGSLVDCLCTAPDEFHGKYYISTTPTPSDAMVAYCKVLAEGGSPTEAWEASGLKSDPAALPKSGGLSKFDKEGKAYLADILNGAGKQVIDFDTNAQATKLAGILKTNEFTGKYFEKSNMFQTAIKWKYYGVPCKSLLDIIHIDDSNETIRPVDLKTTGKSVFSFPTSYMTFKYYLQAAFYTNALRYALEHDERFAAYRDYEVLPFQFIVIETNYKNPPHIFEVDVQDLYVGEFGGNIDGKTYSVRGFKELIEEYDYHNNTNQWDYKSEIYENGGIISLNSLRYEYSSEGVLD